MSSYMIITPTSINFSDKASIGSVSKAIGCTSLDTIPTLLGPSYIAYVDGNGMHKSDLVMNQLANPLISEDWLIRLAHFGGPLGTIVITGESGRLPLKKIQKLYKDYDEDEPGWYPYLERALME